MAVKPVSNNTYAEAALGSEIPTSESNAALRAQKLAPPESERIVLSEAQAEAAEKAEASPDSPAPAPVATTPTSDTAVALRAEKLNPSADGQKNAIAVKATISEIQTGLGRPVITGDFLVKTGQTIGRLTSEQANAVFSQLSPAELNKLAAFSSTPTKYFSGEQRQQLYGAIAGKLDGQQATRFTQAFGRSANRQEAAQVFGQAVNAAREQETAPPAAVGAPNIAAGARQAPPAVAVAPTAGAAPVSAPTANVERYKRLLDREIQLVETLPKSQLNAVYNKERPDNYLQALGQLLGTYASDEQKGRLLPALSQKLEPRNLDRVQQALQPAEQERFKALRPDATGKTEGAAPVSAPVVDAERYKRFLDREISNVRTNEASVVNGAYEVRNNSFLQGLGQALASYGSDEQKRSLLTPLAQKLTPRNLDRVEQALQPAEQELFKTLRPDRSATPPAAAAPARAAEGRATGITPNEFLNQVTEVATTRDGSALNNIFRGISDDQMQHIGQAVSRSSDEQKRSLLTPLAQKLNDEQFSRLESKLQPADRQLLQQLR